jgi:HD-like signal output (HDOD) protein
MLTPTGFAPLREQSISPAIEQMVSRAKTLYTLPSVAAEVLQLTSNPSVETKTIKDCILRDPALTAKILRVVNSSLFGLAGEVSDLNQAIALLGTKPLKILVLGFSLPDSLFAGVAHEELKWYWTTTLTRAVAAREISEQLFKTPGDEAFLAGLLQGLGVLVLAKQLGSSYAILLRSAIDTGVDLRRVEQEALGFDHLHLTSALLREWNMPRQLTEAIANQDDPRTLAREHRLNGTLVRVLHLANLTADLVGQHRLSVLPDLLEAGDAYCELNRARLHELILSLQPKVNQLADVLSLDVGQDADYVSILKAAHEKMSELVESAFGPAQHGSGSDPGTPAAVLQVASELRVAMDKFLRQSTDAPEISSVTQDTSRPSKQTGKTLPVSVNHDAIKCSEQFAEWLVLVAANCRSRREPMSVLVFEVFVGARNMGACEEAITRVLESTCRELLPPNTVVESFGVGKRALAFPALDRHEAVSLTHELIRAIEQSCEQSGDEQEKQLVVSAGISSVSLPSKSFLPGDILDTAERCLAAARSSERSMVKSLEVY